MMDKLVKCEFLSSRKCLLDCEYCRMADGRKNTMPLNVIYQAIDILKSFDCRFIAFYGAEPLEDFKKLPEAVQYAEEQGIHTTVITGGVTTNLWDKLKTLRKHGSPSLTMSYDIALLVGLAEPNQT